MKNYVDVVGIDVSKLTLDAHLHKKAVHSVFSNDSKGFKKLIVWVKSQLGDASVFYCFENTGNYSLKLSIYFAEQGVTYIEENPLTIKRSVGIIRGKSDKLDASMISRYAWLHREELKVKKLKSKELLEIGRLLALRDQFVRNRTGLKSSLKEFKSLLSSPSTDSCSKLVAQSINHCTKQIVKIELRIKELLVSKTELNKNYRLLNTVRGVGLILSCQLLYHTSNFENFKTWRQFSSYCGTAPFEYRSGTSINRSNRCSHIGDRKMKTLLSLASVSAIQHDSELKKYYKNKIEQGKPKMVALNNVRNKLLARVFAVVKRGTPYVELQKYVA